MMKYSFSNENQEEMSYGDFLNKHENDPQSYSLKEVDANVTNILLEDINLPTFYSDIAYLEDVVLYQGSHFVDKPHYID